jgi:integrase
MAYFDRTMGAWRGSIIQDGKRRTKMFRHKGAKGKTGRRGAPAEKGHKEALAWEVQEREKRTFRGRSELYTLMQSFLTEKELQVSRGTFTEYKTVLWGFHEFSKANGLGDILDINRDTCRAFLVARCHECSRNGANDYRSKLLSFFGWVCDELDISHNPISRIKPFKLSHDDAGGKTKRRLVSPEEIFAVIDVAKGHTKRLLQAYWLSGGARRSEILRWRWEDDINFEQRWIRLGTRKTRTGEMVYRYRFMNDDLLQVLRAQQVEKHPKSPWVWTYLKENITRPCHRNLVGQRIQASNLHKIMRALCEEAGVRPFGIHDIRHSVAHFLADEMRLGVKRVQDVLGHQKQGTTEIYLGGSYLSSQPEMNLLKFSNIGGKEYVGGVRDKGAAESPKVIDIKDRRFGI